MPTLSVKNMREQRMDPRTTSTSARLAPWAWLATGTAAVVGLVLLVQSAYALSATYDEVAYIQQATRYYRTGDQHVITRMGSPLTFWKLQQLPTLWLLDRLGHGAWIDDPITHQATLLPILRSGAIWIWLVTLVLVSWWARAMYGQAAMILAAWLFALCPNMLAHGALLTMEMPTTAAFTGFFLLFHTYLKNGRRGWLVSAGLAGGLAFSCKFTAIILPALATLAWVCERPRRERLTVIFYDMTILLIVMMITDLAITGFATLPASERVGAHPSLGRWTALGRLAEWPIPQDWVGLLTQIRHQRSGGPSYLLGERRMHGWWYYYAVALAVKEPLGLIALLLARVGLALRHRGVGRPVGERLLWAVPLAFFLVASLGSTRNYGVRYLLPVMPLLVVWISGLMTAVPWGRVVAGCGIALVAAGTWHAHPYELTFFNSLAGGTHGGRGILADSNLDWGQGARALARLQFQRPELQDLTLYYFGATDPRHYGVRGTVYLIDAGEDHPGLPVGLSCTTAYLGVSASLAWGPWGPPHYFDALRKPDPLAWTPDGTIALYRASDLGSDIMPLPPAVETENE
jgi:hypothetical protein